MLKQLKLYVVCTFLVLEVQPNLAPDVGIIEQIL